VRHDAAVLRGGLLERRVEAWLAAAHVVRAHVRLADPLEDEDRPEDLALGGARQRVPLIHGRAGGSNVREHDGLARDVRKRPLMGKRPAGERPWEADLVRLHDVPDERGHRHAAMLDLGVAQEADGRLVALLPEVLLGEVERIPESLKDEQQGHSAEKNIIQLLTW